MKDIKSYIIGFLMATCMFLFMGQTMSDTQIGRYEIEVLHNDTLSADINYYNYFLFDTKVGEVIRFGKMSKSSEMLLVREESTISYVEDKK